MTGGRGGAGRTERGNRTRAKLIEAAEQVFAELGYHEASIVKITEAAGVAQGTFYLYFKGKKQIFDELVEDLNRRVRHAMSEASAAGSNRIESERLGFGAFFRLHYTRIVEGYVDGLDKAKSNGEITDLDTSVAAWALMGIGELVGMRWALWDAASTGMPDQVFEEVMALIQRALGARDVPGRGPNPSGRRGQP
jgi:AcrR family transcriptional regulator